MVNNHVAWNPAAAKTMSPVLIWFALGLGLVLLEFVVPGVVLVFFGLAAWIVTLLVWIGVLESPPAQLAVFMITSLLLLFGCRRFVKKWFVGDSQVDAPDGIEDILGKHVTVIADIPGGPATGTVELKGAEWSARSDAPLERGSLATVKERDGLVLVVQPR